MSGRDELPPDVEELDRALRAVRFEPRASLGPELAGRVRRGERSKGAASFRRIPVSFWAAGAAVVVGAAVLRGDRPEAEVTVDRCCYDLDGGGAADDGVVLVAERDAQVRRLRVYEDRDGSGAFTEPDLVRLDRGAALAMHAAPGRGLVTIERCCLDFDGGGRDDDALLVLGVPPDRVVMAAIYEHPRASSATSPTPPLR
jgi:hypothetical protein